MSQKAKLFLMPKEITLEKRGNEYTRIDRSPSQLNMLIIDGADNSIYAISVRP